MIFRMLSELNPNERIRNLTDKSSKEINELLDNFFEDSLILLQDDFIVEVEDIYLPFIGEFGDINEEIKDSKKRDLDSLLFFATLNKISKDIISIFKEELKDCQYSKNIAVIVEDRLKHYIRNFKCKKTFSYQHIVCAIGECCPDDDGWYYCSKNILFQSIKNVWIYNFSDFQYNDKIWLENFKKRLERILTEIKRYKVYIIVGNPTKEILNAIPKDRIVFVFGNAGDIDISMRNIPDLLDFLKIVQKPELVFEKIVELYKERKLPSKITAYLNKYGSEYNEEIVKNVIELFKEIKNVKMI